MINSSSQNRIEITTSPEDNLPIITLLHQLYGINEINAPYVALLDPDDVILAAEVALDLDDSALSGLPVFDLRNK